MTTADGAIVGTTKVVDHGPAALRWNMVILGDGYRAAELADYHTAVDTFIDYLYGVTPFNEAWHGINIYRVDVSSTDSSADDPVACADGSAGSGAAPATYFDSTFCFDGTTRRLLAGNDVTALTVSKGQVPQVHVTLVIVNSPAYGGAGSLVAPLAWFSAHPDSAQIGVHELGHSFFGLQDEYGDVTNTYVGQEPVAPNVTKDTARATTKWRVRILPATPIPTMSNPNCAQEDTRPSLVGVGTVGLFEGGGRAHCALYRAEYNCAMRTLGRPFCVICQQRIRTMLAQYGGAMSWELAGNAGTNGVKDFVGTTDNQPLTIRTNGAERLCITAAGNVGIGTTAPASTLTVEVAGSVNPISGLSIDVDSFGTFSNALGSHFFRVRDIQAAPPNGVTYFSIGGTGNVGVGAAQASSRLSVVAAGASELGGTARSTALLTSAGPLGPAAGSELALATIGFDTGNNTSLGIRAQRTANGSSWTTTAIGLGMDVDNTVRAGASLWLHANGNVGVGAAQPDARLSVVAAGASELGGTARSTALLTSAGPLGPAAGSELALATIGFNDANNIGLGVRARRTANGPSWTTTAIGLGMDVDNTVRAGASLWLHANGNVRIGLGPVPTERLEVQAQSGRTAVYAEGFGAAPAIFGVNNQGPAFGGQAGGATSASAGFGVTAGTGPGLLGRAVQTTVTSTGVVGLIGSNPTPPAANQSGGIGVIGVSPTGTGVAGGTTGQGNLRGGSTGNGTEGYYGGSGLGAGVHALALGGKAVALYAEASLAGLFLGDVAVQGTLAASVKAFKIDHPLDPANRFLTHSSIECPDMMNIYNGNVVTDQDGRAHIVLPNYFQALNREFRYQLTPISGFSQVTVEQEIEDNRFSIRTDKPHVHVSWQVTGVRHDAYAEAHHIEVEQDKSEAERGRYLHPELYGTVAGAERRSIGYLPGMFGDPSVVHYSASDDGTPT